MMTMNKFYDTSSLLLAQERAFDEPFYVSSITLSELEHIKASDTKSQDIKYKARNLVRLLNAHQDLFTVVIDDTAVRANLEKHFLPLSSDNLILASAAMTSCEVVYSEDLCMRLVGRQVFDLNTTPYETREEHAAYSGYKQVQMGESEYATFLHKLTENQFGCVVNEYIIIYSSEYEILDCFKWSGSEFVPAYNKITRTISMGDKIKAKDEFQRCAIDALMEPEIKLVALGGKAGSGKTYLNLMCAMAQVDSGKYERIVFTSNNIPMRGCASYGYTPGSLLQKLTDANEGNILLSKFSDINQFNALVMQDKIRLLDLSSCRGTEIKNSILLCSEMQNTSPDIMKTIISRVHSSSKMVFDFDAETQIDSTMFEANNGALRTVVALQGQKEFAYVYLPNTYRSELAKLACLI